MGGSFSARPHYALRCAYFDAVSRAGGLPIALPYNKETTEDLLSLCNGLVLPGGTYTFPDILYGHETNLNEKIHPRYQFESEFTLRALDAELPMLGICAGMQMIAAAKGATFYSDVRLELPSAIDHLNACPAENTAHRIDITPGTQLRKIIAVDHLEVNTAHKEAIKDNFGNLTISARAPDTVIEGIELPDHPFCIGVQWHPEFFAHKGDPNFKLFTALIRAAKGEGG